MNNHPEWYSIDNVGEVDSPALVVYPERVKANIDAAVAMVEAVAQLRPHIKTCKSPDAVGLMLAAGITKFKCASIAEAEMLGRCGAPDVLLAYQPIGPKVRRFVSVITQFAGTRYSCLADNREAAERMAEVFVLAGLVVPVFIDLNLGMDRTGIPPGTAAVALYASCNGLPGIKAVGLHGYDGHIRDKDFAARKKACDDSFGRVVDLQLQITAAGFPSPLLIMGGSPTFSIHCRRKGIECSPGTFVYWDKGYGDLCPEQPFQPAALVLTRVISQPSIDRVCTDMGHKSIAAENDIARRAYFLNAPALQLVSQSEEHGIVGSPPGDLPGTGDILYVLPFHICPTVALYEEAIAIVDGKVSGSWRNLARDRKITI